MSRDLLNTLYVMTPGAFARLEGDTVRVDVEHQKILQVPLLHLGGITVFGGATVSAPLMERCAAEGRQVVLMDMGGRFKARIVGPTSGNVLLRKAQYQIAVDSTLALSVARQIVAGKIQNTRLTLMRSARDSSDTVKTNRLRLHADILADQLAQLPSANTLDQVRGIEGQSAACYFDVFDAMINRDPADFAFKRRTRRPPRDRVNALLSFVYALLAGDCTGAVEGVGLDPQFGFLHALRPGRPALALDLMEEFRSIIADRLVLSLINRRQINPAHFENREGGAVLLNEDGRKVVLVAYQKRKQEEVTHPMLQQSTPFGLLPHLQARLLARHLRGDLAGYLPYISK